VLICIAIIRIRPTCFFQQYDNEPFKKVLQLLRSFSNENSFCRCDFYLSNVGATDFDINCVSLVLVELFLKHHVSDVHSISERHSLRLISFVKTKWQGRNVLFHDIGKERFLNCLFTLNLLLVKIIDRITFSKLRNVPIIHCCVLISM
jgi:hypothetical protein